MKTYQYTESELYSFLYGLLDDKKATFYNTLIHRLVYLCRVTESEALNIFNQSVKSGFLVTGVKPKCSLEKRAYFANLPKGNTENTDFEIIDNDASDKGISATAHNNKESIVPKSGRYGKDRINKKGSFSRLQTRKPQ
jgi:hypothetical protein